MQPNPSGIVVAAVAIVGIGLGHVWVRKMEYSFGKRIWPLSAAIGLVLLGASLAASSDFVAALLAIPGAIFLYAVKEFFEQERRVIAGHAPRNPKRRYPGDAPSGSESAHGAGEGRP
ncbi:MAG: DUF4491 family protein [Candidatus Binatia bacterium]